MGDRSPIFDTEDPVYINGERESKYPNPTSTPLQRLKSSTNLKYAAIFIACSIGLILYIDLKVKQNKSTGRADRDYQDVQRQIADMKSSLRKSCTRLLYKQADVKPGKALNILTPFTGTLSVCTGWTGTKDMQVDLLNSTDGVIAVTKVSAVNERHILLRIMAEPIYGDAYEHTGGFGPLPKDVTEICVKWSAVAVNDLDIYVGNLEDRRVLDSSTTMPTDKGSTLSDIAKIKVSSNMNVVNITQHFCNI